MSRITPGELRRAHFEICTHRGAPVAYTLTVPERDVVYTVHPNGHADTRLITGIKARKIALHGDTARMLRREVSVRLRRRPSGWPEEQSEPRVMKVERIWAQPFDGYNVEAEDNRYFVLLEPEHVSVLKHGVFHPLKLTGPTAQALLAAVREHVKAAA